jgi:hypothetical protein
MMRTLLRRRLNPDLCSLHARYGMYYWPEWELNLD